MARDFEVRWEGVLPAGPAEAWKAITEDGASWFWRVEYEPRVGGAERGLTPGGGRVTAWEPHAHFATRAAGDDGWHNALDYRLESRGEGTLLRFTHTSVLPEDEYELQLDACRRHTDMYYATLAEYLAHFGGRRATQVEFDVPGSFTEVAGRLRPTGTVDYEAPGFLGVRTTDALVRVIGREAWGGATAVSLHLFAAGADPQHEQERILEAIA